MKTFCVLIALLILAFTGTTRAQNFSYSLSSGTGTYTDLGGATSLSNGSDWNNTLYKLPIGFSFPFAGQNFDSLTIEPNGFLVFDTKRNYAFAIYKGLFCKQDTNNSWSGLSYLSSGGILKIQYKNVGFYQYDKRELFNFQVWLYSNGNIEVHTGSNPNADYTANDQTTLLGLINMNQDTNPKAFVASGDPNSPTGTTIGTNDPLVYLNPIPVNGTVFTFVP